VSSRGSGSVASCAAPAAVVLEGGGAKSAPKQRRRWREVRPDAAAWIFSSARERRRVSALVVKGCCEPWGAGGGHPRRRWREVQDIAIEHEKIQG
jgi:hypothetical protein